MWLKFFVVGLVVVSLSECLIAQEPTDDRSDSTVQDTLRTTTPQPVLENIRGLTEDYRVGVGDLLEIQVVDHQDLSQSLRISASGEIRFSLVGSIQVAGLTASEVEATISSRLSEKRLIVQPEVLVFIREYQAKRIYVTGEVENPGGLIMSRDLTVMDAILLAGGLRAPADRYGYVHRRALPEGANAVVTEEVVEKLGDAEPGAEVVKVDLQPLQEGLLPIPDLRLRNGDVLVVPRKTLNFFYVVGDVHRPLNYPMQQPTLLVSQAISMSGGPTPTAKASDGLLVRYSSDGSRTETKVDFGAILKGEQKDFVVQANDVIFIPGSKAKTVEEAFVGMTDVMIMQQTFRIGRQMQRSSLAREAANAREQYLNQSE